MRKVVILAKKVYFSPFFEKSYVHDMLIEPFIFLFLSFACDVCLSLLITDIECDSKRLTIATNSILKFIRLRFGWIKAKYVIAIKVDLSLILDGNNFLRQNISTVL